MPFHCWQRCVVLTWVLSLACTDASSDPLDWKLATGGTINSLVTGADTVDLLIVASDQCFSCGYLVPAWLARRQANEHAQLLLFSRAPTPSESAQLTTFGVIADGFLATPPPMVADGQPRHLQIVGGHVVAITSLK